MDLESRTGTLLALVALLVTATPVTAEPTEDSGGLALVDVRVNTTCKSTELVQVAYFPDEARATIEGAIDRCGWGSASELFPTPLPSLTFECQPPEGNTVVCEQMDFRDDGYQWNGLVLSEDGAIFAGGENCVYDLDTGWNICNHWHMEGSTI